MSGGRKVKPAITALSSILRVAQKPEGVKFMELLRIDYRIMYPALTDGNAKEFDEWLRGEISRGLRLHGIRFSLWRTGPDEWDCHYWRETLSTLLNGVAAMD
jgi:hypothetical protein